MVTPLTACPESTSTESTGTTVQATVSFDAENNHVNVTPMSLQVEVGQSVVWSASEFLDDYVIELTFPNFPDPRKGPFLAMNHGDGTLIGLGYDPVVNGTRLCKVTYTAEMVSTRTGLRTGTIDDPVIDTQGDPPGPVEEA